MSAPPRPFRPDPSRRHDPGALRPRVVDASMTLLNEVMHHPLDPGYAEAARRRAARGSRPRTRWASALVLVLLVVCGWTATVAASALRRPGPDAAEARERLVSQIEGHLATRRQLESALATSRAEASALEDDLLSLSGATALRAQGRSLGAQVGAEAVQGAGLRVVLDDAGSGTDDAQVDPRASSADDDGRVIDRDVQVAVNGLWASGARAVAVNGQRLTALSAIRSAGEAILVDFRPLSPPYVIDAVGDPGTLSAGLQGDLAGTYLETIRSTYGVQVEISEQDDLDLPAASSLQLRSARVATTTPSAVPTGTATGSPGTGGTVPGTSSITTEGTQ